MANNKLGRVAFITTPKFRKTSSNIVQEFIMYYLYILCNMCDVVSTGNTYDFIQAVLRKRFTPEQKMKILKSANLDTDLDPANGMKIWKKKIKGNMERVHSGVIGMISLGHDLVESRLDAIIHFSDWDDVIGKPDSMVLRREANVHNIPIATDYHSAVAAVKSWNSSFASKSTIFRDRPKPEFYPLSALTKEQSNIALIAHDKMKLDLCCFFVEYADKIFKNYNNILATGTTGSRLVEFTRAIGKNESDILKIRCCESGPFGGDVQIAAAVVKGLCNKVIFLQDPHTSHPHEIDIKLFEQAILLFRQVAISNKFDLELATNLESAKVLIGKK